MSLRRHLLYHAAVLAACVLSVAPSSGAEGLDPANALAQFAPPAEAVVYLIAPAASFRFALDETRMQKAACRFVSHDPEAIGALVDLVRRSEPRAALRVGGLDLRAGVYLVSAEGATMDVILGAEYAGVPASGVLRQSGSGDVRAVDIAAAPSLAADLRAWAKRFGGGGDGGACGQLH